MTGLSRKLGLGLVLAAALQTPAWAARPDELQDQFQMAVDMLARGKKDESLAALRKVLGMSPDSKAAYALWTNNDYVVWRDLLVQGGEFELSARRLMELARVERNALKNDKDAILKEVEAATTTSTDVLERRKAVRVLTADHGEYAVPYLVALLGEQTDGDRRTLAMHALSQMNTEVVVPLSEALKSPNPMVRRNVAFVLGNIMDPRSAAALQHTAKSDADEVVRTAATEALARMKASGDALSNYLAAGDAYYHRSDAALHRGEAGEVVWDWKGDALVGTPIPRSLYGSEMSKRCYFHALEVDPSSSAALAGLARAYVDTQTRIDQMVAAGQDVGAWKDKAGETLLAVNGAGVPALDGALRSAIEAGDASTGSALCRLLAPLASGGTPGLQMGIASTDGAIRSESAVALAQIALRTRAVPSANVIKLLGEASGREALRLVLVIDGDAHRGEATAEAIRALGAHANSVTSGTMGLVVARRSPALDAILVADALPDLTTAQVIDEVKGDERMAAIPIVLISAEKDKATAAAPYGERVVGTSTGAGDLDALKAPLAAELQGDRALAEDLAGRATVILARLAQSGVDVSGALAGLVMAVGRADAIAIPAIQALGAAGGSGQAATLLAVLTDEKRSEVARAEAGKALAAAVAHGATLDADAVGKVRAVVNSAAPMTVRQSAAQVIGSLSISPADRAAMLQQLRGN